MNINELSDKVLMFEYQNGDSSAFDILYQRHNQKVFSYIRRRLKNREESEEIFQQVFAKLHNSRATYSNQYEFTQWLFVIIKSVLLDHWQREKSRREKRMGYHEEQQVLEVNSVQGLDVSDDLLVQVKSGMGDLTSEQKKVLEMRVFDELSYDEIAARLNASEVGVRKTVSRAIKKLKQQMQINGGGKS
jgi:RNA polymerase sigma-70 factor (ECF subfamily)